jgi:hypothetical protein
MNDSTRRFVKDQLIWIGIYFGIAILVGFFLDFPISLIVILAIIIPLSLYRRRRFFRNNGRGSFFGGASMFGPKSINYYCINCGTKHNQAQCPNCGSKLKKAGFGE